MNTELIELTDLRIAKTVCDLAYSNEKPNARILKEVLSKITEIPYEVLMSKTRKREVVNTRQIGMWYYHKHKNKGNKLNTLESIGHEFGGKDHATVLHSVREVEGKLSINDEFFKTTIYKMYDELKKINKDFLL